MALRPPSRVFVGLAEPALIDGVEPKLLMLNGGLFVFVLILFKGYGFFFFPITWLVHQALKAISKSDPFVRLIYLVYQRQADRYEPFPDKSPRGRQRPEDFGRGVVG